MADFLKNHSGVIVLIALAIISAVIWSKNGEKPIFVFGWAAVLWLFSLMVRGVFFAPYKPFADDDAPRKTAQIPEDN